MTGRGETRGRRREVGSRFRRGCTAGDLHDADALAPEAVQPLLERAGIVLDRDVETFPGGLDPRADLPSPRRVPCLAILVP
jgi:hypothetical protein